MINPLEKFNPANDTTDSIKVIEEKPQIFNVLIEGKGQTEVVEYYHFIKIDDDRKRILKEKNQEIDFKNKTISNLMDRLNKFDEYNEVTWTLKYIYQVDGVTKEFEQNGMLKEDAEELIGMDSDNWTHWSLTKEERPNKDQIIEGLLARCESSEEIIGTLNETIIELNKKISELEEEIKELEGLLESR